jgi:transposase
MHHLKEASVTEVSTIGLDIAKRTFHAHGADVSGNVLFRRKICWAKLLAFFAAQPRCLVAMEACGGAHHWGREISKLGHTVCLITPAYVKPFVKRQKNDSAHAEAICEAAQRPTRRFVSVKSEAGQASALVFRTRDLLVRQHTQITNALRGHITEYGWVVAQGPARVAELIEHIEDPACALPGEARSILCLREGEIKVNTRRCCTKGLSKQVTDTKRNSMDVPVPTLGGKDGLGAHSRGVAHVCSLPAI